MPWKEDIIWYHPDLKLQAQELRKNSTISEKLLWKELKGKKLKGYDFHRQKPINYYIVDFYCPKLKLVIEIDGTVHDCEESLIKDIRRQENLEEFGLTFLRFKDQEVRHDVKAVIEIIGKWIDNNEEST